MVYRSSLTNTSGVKQGSRLPRTQSTSQALCVGPGVRIRVTSGDLATLVEGPVTRAAQGTEAGQQDDEQGEDGRTVSEHFLMNRKPPYKRREGGKRSGTRSKSEGVERAGRKHKPELEEPVGAFFKAFLKVHPVSRNATNITVKMGMRKAPSGRLKTPSAGGVG